VISALARPAVARLVRAPRAWAFGAGWCALALALAVSARTQGLAHGADHVLLDAYGAIVLPLLAFGLVGSLVGSSSLSANLAPLTAYGAPPVLAAATTLGVALVPCITLGAVLAALLAIVAHGSGDPPVARDALASAYAGALGGAAYASLFALGSSLGRRGGGRALLLVADWFFGAAGGVLSLVTPRAHLRNLLGGAAPMDLPGGASAAVLVLLTVAYLAATLARSRRVK
jgi:hypothetical protein